jgi:hypothetical protein
METIDSKPVAVRNSPGMLYGMFVVALAVTLLANLFIRMAQEAGWLSQGVLAAIGVLAVVPLVVAAVLFGRMLRGTLDEMLQRIVLEGMAMGLILYVPLAALYVNLRVSGVWTPRLDPPDIVMVPAVLVAAGIAIAIRRYR